tara:strand:- start:1424 stop:2023 length:600 start_codon:yes stop_codon:yes gene_type:complete
MGTISEKILNLANTQGLIHSRDVTKRGMPRSVLARLIKKGQLTRLGRGLYAVNDRETSANINMAEVALMYPKGIICLLSALRIHELTTQSPFEVWLAIPNKNQPPKIDYPPLRIVRFSGKALTEGIEERQIDGTTVRVTCLARTVVDCFKFRNKIGIDVAIEALQEAIRSKRTTMDDLWYFAKMYRMAKVMRPYMESLS